METSELDQMGLHGADFKKSGTDSFRGPCPKCGGSRRFVVFTDNPWPRFYGLCDECGFKGWADQINPALKPQAYDPLEQKMREHIAQEHVVKREAERKTALESFRAKIDINSLHSGMSEDNRRWWKEQGISEKWQDFWDLGYLENRLFQYNGSSYESPCYTIPKYDLGWELMNIDYRLLSPPKEGSGKYRQEFGLASAAFISRPDLPELHVNGTVYVVEGSKKAMVTSIKGNSAQVIGLPGCTSWAGVPGRLKTVEQVFVIFDPDAGEWAQRFTAQVGSNAKALSLPIKIDDAFNSGGLTWTLFQKLLKQARRA